MRIQTAALLAALLPSLTLADAPALDAKSITNAEGLRDQAMRGSDAYAIVESLTTEVGPRMGGSPGIRPCHRMGAGEIHVIGLRQGLAAAGHFPGLAAPCRKRTRAQPVSAAPGVDRAGRQ